MTAFDTLSDRDAPARASGLPIVGYLANTVPVELIRAAGCFAQGIAGSPDDDVPDALTRMEDFFTGGILSIFQRYLDGRLGHLAALVIPRSSEEHLQLYYHALAVWKEAPKGRPRPILFDILHTPFDTTARYNAGRLVRLRDRLGALGHGVTEDALAEAVAEADAVRRALARLNALRTAEGPRVGGAEMLRAIAATTVMAPRDAVAAAEALRAAAEGRPARSCPRLLLTGSPHDTDGFHEVVEAHGATITGDDHGTGDWWFLDPVGGGDPMAALLRKYHLHAPSPRTYPRAAGDIRLMQAATRARPDAAVFFTLEWDDTLGFDLPTQRALLADRGIPCLFLKDQSYRTPDRAAQADAVARLLEMEAAE